MNRMLLLFGALLGAALQIQAQGHSVPDAVLEDHRRVVPGEIVVKFVDAADCDVVYDNMGKALSAFDVLSFLPEGVVVAESKVGGGKKRARTHPTASTKLERPLIDPSSSST